MKIKIPQLKTINNDWPISGCIKSKDITTAVIINDIRYFKFLFWIFLLHKIIDVITIKNGFNISIGWNRGKKNRSIHLFEPLTSMPINGIKIKKNSETKKEI